MRIILLFLLILAQPLAADETYHGPLDLEFGISEAEVREVMETRFQLVEKRQVAGGRLLELVYQGVFSGMDAIVNISVIADEDEYVGTLVLPDVDPLRPSSMHLMEMVELMEEAYGEPDAFTPPPDWADSQRELIEQVEDPKRRERLKAIQSLREETSSEYEMMDMYITDGTWEPAYAWRFDNASVLISAQIDTHELAPEMSVPIVQPVWGFVVQDRINEVLEGRDRDF